jgi:hypothetical protein
LNETLGILGPADDRCVPESCLGDDLLEDIRSKFHMIFYPALRWARQKLADSGYTARRLLALVLVVEPSFEDRSQIAVVDDTTGHVDYPAYCYLYENPKAWDWSFPNLTAVANAVINFRDRVVEEFLRNNGRRSA